MYRKQFFVGSLAVSLSAALLGACGGGGDASPSADGADGAASGSDAASTSDGPTGSSSDAGQGKSDAGASASDAASSAKDGGGDAGAPGYALTNLSGTITSEDGDAVTFAVALTSPPTAPVTLDLAVSMPLEATVDKPQLSFNAVNWAQPQTVTVTGLDDAALDGDQPYQVTFAPAASSDARYAGTRPAALSFTNYDNDEGPIDVIAGDSLNIVRFADGRVKGWGQRAGYTDPRTGVGNMPNQMGKSLAYIDFGAGRTVTKVVASGNSGFICAFLDDATVHCWGNNEKGQLGFGDTVQRLAGPMGPLDLGTGKTIKSLAMGGSHACALLNDDTVKCWGQNMDGELGLGDNVTRGDNPNEMGDNLPTVDLGTGRTAKAVFAGEHVSCAILDDDSLKCWGQNGVGELGIGAALTRGNAPNQMGDNLPVVSLGGTPVTMALGISHSCALLVGGAMKCWGFNGYGELAYGDTKNRGLSPSDMGASLPAVNLGTNRHAVSVSVGWASSCAVLDDGSVKCWGYYSSGILGDGDTRSRGALPSDVGDGLPRVDLGPGRTALSVTVGFSHACAVLDTHRVKCWGYNHEGELGLGDALTRGNAPGQMGAALPAASLR